MLSLYFQIVYKPPLIHPSRRRSPLKFVDCFVSNSRREWKCLLRLNRDEEIAGCVSICKWYFHLLPTWTYNIATALYGCHRSKFVFVSVRLHSSISIFFLHSNFYCAYCCLRVTTNMEEIKQNLMKINCEQTRILICSTHKRISYIVGFVNVKRFMVYKRWLKLQAAFHS